MSAPSHLSAFSGPRKLDDESSGGKTDVEISKGFEGVTNAILSWVEAIDQSERPYVYHNLVTRDKKSPEYAHLKPLGLWRDRNDDMWMSWLSGKDACNSVVVSLVIWRFLQSKVFDSFFPVHDGSDKAEAASWQRLVELVVNEMKRTGQDKDGAIRAGVWRSETMKAIIRCKDREGKRFPAGDALLKGLLRDLGHWVRQKVLARSDMEDMLRDKVVRSSFELHDDMRRSWQEYDLRAADFRYGQIDQKPHAAEAWTLMNIKTWITTKYATVDGLFYPLFPGLYRLGKGNEDELVLVQPIVVAFKNGARQLAQAHSTPEDEAVDGSSYLANSSSENSTTNTARGRDGGESSRTPDSGHFSPLRRVQTAFATFEPYQTHHKGYSSRRLSK